MTKRMKGWVLHGIGDFRLEDLEVPQLSDDEILVKVRAAGVCGSDMPRIYELGTRVPDVVLGHEFGGEIVAVANESDRELLGSRAAVFPLIPCRTCESCIRGRYVQCENYDYLGSRRNGGFAEYCVVPSRWHLLVAPHAVSFEQLAMVEPSSVAQHAVRNGGVRQGDRVVVFGAGTIGIVVARWVKAAGATPVMVDLESEKLDFAREAGFKAIQAGDRTVHLLREALEGYDADVVIEGTGAGGSLTAAARITKRQGTIVLLGNPHRDTTIALRSHSEVLRREIDIKGVWNSEYLGAIESEWTRTLSAMADGTLETGDLISHKVQLTQLGDLLHQAHTGVVHPWKVMVVDGV